MNKLIVFLILGLSLIVSKPLFDSNTSYVTTITSYNYNDQIQKIRQSTNMVHVMNYFKRGDGFSEQFAPQYDKWASEYKGCFRINAVDCDDQAALCEKEKITKFPTFKILLPEPFPAIEMEGEITIPALQKKAAKQLHSKNVIEVTNTNAQTFISESPSVPKVLLFTESPKGVPMIYKGLSVAFENKLFFGLVRSSDKILVDKYRIKKFPSIIILKTNEKKPIVYDGDINFQDIHTFLNVYSETFVPGGGSSFDSAATKQWLTEVVPELYTKSANDICLKVDGALCVIHIGKGKPESDVMNVLKDLNVAYDRKIDRGSQYKFMWLDAEKEQKYASIFGYTGEDRVVVLNSGKRKRFVAHQGDFTYKALNDTLEKINGGDARFTRVELPQFTARD